MDRRFIAWLLLTASLFLIWTSFRQRFAPPQETNATTSTENKNTPRSNPSISAPQQGEIQAFEGNLSKHTLGSLDPKAGYRLLVTLSSKGAGVERIELVEQMQPGKFRYRALEGEGAYAGYLALEETPDGLKVRSVPQGSPASQAICKEDATSVGLQVGDVITKVDEKSVLFLDDWWKILKKLNPGHNVEFKIEREIAGQKKSLTFTTDLIQTPMDVVRVVDDQINEEATGNALRDSCLTTLARLDNAAIPVGAHSIEGLERILQGYWEPRPLQIENGMGIEFVLPLDGWITKAGLKGKLELVKQYRLKGGIANESSNELSGYELELKTLVRNTDTEAHQVSLRQESFNGLTLEGWWYLSKLSPYMFTGAGSRDVVYSSEELGHRLQPRGSIYSAARDNPSNASQLFVTPNLSAGRRSLKYLGVDAQFFAAAMLPHPEQPDSMKDVHQAATELLADPVKMARKQMAANVGAWFDTPVVTLEPNQEFARSYLLFAGPKEPKLLERYGLGNLIEYGWFGWVARPLTWILHSFYAVARNYGIAIIMLTVLVRSCMFPLSRNAALNAQKMQEVAPELKRINDQYKDDWEKRTKATQEVYKKANFNPMAGCLPLFVQLPIFIGLYRAVSTDIHLRQQALIPGLEWCSNLAGPDMLLEWSTWMPDFIAGKGTGWFGPYFNLLPIITITLFIIQQKVLMPKATDEQQQMTQTMMMYMTIFMGVLFFKVPAGLCLYFITSSTWSLVERRLVKKMVPTKPVEVATDVGALKADAKQAEKSEKNDPFRAKPKSAQSRSQRPEKLSDVFPWMSRFEKKEEKDSSKPKQDKRKK
ncbi:MAG: YidC/Oxa1 family insertase periplasmic-domain containing protein [Pirellulales bacterium]